MQNSNIITHNTDIIEFLKNYNGPKFHSVISDPPYGLAFMGKSWDKYTPLEYQTWCSEWGKELIKHLYPGSVCMFFGGTRTYHRLATGLEDAGFEIFDSMIWCYGSGFPKSYNISKGIDKEFGLEREIIGTTTIPKTFTREYQSMQGYRPNGDGFKGEIDGANITKPNHPLAHQYNGYGTALKPAFEPIVLCRKPRGKETFVDCVLNYGSGSLNMDGSRISGSWNKSTPYVQDIRSNNYGHASDKRLEKEPQFSHNLGRFPANLGLICKCEKEPCECIERELNNQSGNGFVGHYPKINKRGQTNVFGKFNGQIQNEKYLNKGGASRFFYTAKSSRKERNLGLDIQNNHPTVKPIKLIEYLATMLKPPIENSSILIPFSGSGSEIIGAMFSGWQNITGIEIDENYTRIANERINYWKQFSSYADGLKGK